MNTGIGDAVNLAWKLAAVLHGRADASLLDSYEPERIAFARRLVATTDRGVHGRDERRARSRGWCGCTSCRSCSRLITMLAPLRRFMFRTISQTAVNYRGSRLSEGRAGTVHGGDRLPWVKPPTNGDGQDNFTPLTSLDWQVHVYGDATPELQAALR